MNRMKYLVFSLYLVNVGAFAEIKLTEESVMAIIEEVSQAEKKKDISVLEKYMYPGTKITVDMDPAVNRGEKEIDYEEFLSLTKMAFAMMEDAEIHRELIFIRIDDVENQATVEEKTTALIKMMGMEMEDVSITKTTFGIVDGEIKVISTEDQLISSAPLP